MDKLIKQIVFEKKKSHGLKNDFVSVPSRWTWRRSDWPRAAAAAAIGGGGQERRRRRPGTAAAAAARNGG